MSRIVLAIIAVLLSSSCSPTVVTPTEITDEQRERAIRYTLNAHERGVEQSVIVDRIVARTGWDRDAVARAVASAIGRNGRDPSSRRVEQIGVLVANGSAAVATAALAAAYCSPLGDENDAVEYAACLDDNASFLGEPWCRISNDADVARGARLWVTASQRQRLGDAWAALGLGALGEVVRNADDAAYMAAATARNIKRCPSPEPTP